MKPLTFKKSNPFTIGVELEFQLLDPQTFDLSPKGPQLLGTIDPSLKPYIKAEFIRSMVEISTPVCRDMTDVEGHLTTLCRTVEKLAADCGCSCFSSSLHPFAAVRDRQTSPGTRYDEIMQDLQLSGRRMMTQAMHVHIGMTDRQQTIRVCDEIRQYLPILLALTTSSPWLEGADTGFYSYRSNIFCCLPRTGIPETLQSWENFEEIVAILNQSTILKGIKELWWDVRPHPDFGTIEIRICDLPSKMKDILAITALTQALVATLSERESSGRQIREIIYHNKWHASRYGLDGTFIRQRAGNHPSFRKAAEELLELVSDKTASFKTEHFLDDIRRIVRYGTSAHRQKEIYEKYNDLKAVIEIMQKEFWH